MGVKLEYPQSVKGRQEYVYFYPLMAIAFSLIIVFYSMETETITEQQSTDTGDDCTENSANLETLYGTLGNFPGGDCRSNWDETIANADVMMYQWDQVLRGSSGSTHDQSMDIKFNWIRYGGATVTVKMNYIVYQSNTDQAKKGGSVVKRCGTAAFSTTDRCCQLAYEWAWDPNVDRLYSQPACPTAQQVRNPGEFLAEAAPSYVTPSGWTVAPDDDAKSSMNRSLSLTMNYARNMLCDIKDQAYRSFTCKRKVHHSPFTIFVTSITVLTTVYGFLFATFAHFYGPDAHEPDDVVKEMHKGSGSAMELKSTSGMA
eukprot:jgi/Bigna1/77078/fgenesh1_pg.45_\